MKKAILHIMFSCLFLSPVLASYTYEVYTYGENETLIGTESILIDQQGGMDRLTLRENSSGTIQGTSSLGDGTGGIWEINLFDNSQLQFSGGDLGNLDIFNDATVILSGGSIVSIESNQNAWMWAGDPPEQVPNPHITIIYSGDLPTVDASNVLAGLWGNGDPFSIYLSDVPEGYGYSPAIENIQFIPEPATLALFGLGTFLIRRKK